MHLSSAEIYEFLYSGHAISRIFRRIMPNTQIIPLSQKVIDAFIQLEQKYITKYGINEAPFKALMALISEKSALSVYLFDLLQGFKKLIEHQLMIGEPITDLFQSEYELKIAVINAKVLLKTYQVDCLTTLHSFSLKQFEEIESLLFKRLDYNIRLTRNIHDALIYMFYQYWEKNCKENPDLFLKKCPLLFALRQTAEEKNWPENYAKSLKTELNFDPFTELFELQLPLKGYLGETLDQLPKIFSTIDNTYWFLTKKTHKNFIRNGLKILAPDQKHGLHLIKRKKNEYQLICPEHEKEIFILQHLLPKNLYQLIQDPEKHTRYQSLLKNYPILEDNQLYFNFTNDSYAIEYQAIINSFFLKAFELLKLRPQQMYLPFHQAALSYHDKNTIQRQYAIQLIAEAENVSSILAMRKLWFNDASFLDYGLINTSKHWSITPEGKPVRISERNSRINLLCALKIYWFFIKGEQFKTLDAFTQFVEKNPQFLFLKAARKTYLFDLDTETSSVYQTYCQYLKNQPSDQNNTNMLNYLETRWHQYLTKIEKQLLIPIETKEMPIDSSELKASMTMV